MNKNLKVFLSIIAALFIAGASLAYGAMTAPTKQSTVNPQTSVSQSPRPSVSPSPQPLSSEEKLAIELPIVQTVLSTKYPKIATNYTLGGSKLYSDGKWFGAFLTYKGSESLNRDTLRVLLEKKDDTWVIRTTPPRILLSKNDFPDVPVSVLKEINRAVSLPAGGENSPAISRDE